MQLGFVIDHSRCIGCHACTVACKSENDVPVGKFRTWVKYVETGVFPTTQRSFAVLRCNQCTDAPCVTICPTVALFKREDGVVDLDADACVGCKSCMQACPYDALYIHDDQGTAQKCHFCVHRTEKGLAPACAVVCPTEAIIPGDFHDPTSAVSVLKAAGGLEARKTEAGTGPNVFYREVDKVALDPLKTSSANGYLWANQQTDATLLGELAEAAAKRAANEPGDELGRTVYDVSHPSPWGGKVAAYLFTKSLAAGAFLVALPAMLTAGPATLLGETFTALLTLATVALAATSVLLVADLKRPERFLMLLTRGNKKSWLVRGAYLLMGYSGCLAIWWTWRLLGYVPSTAIGTSLAILTAALAVLTAIYTAWLFGQAKGRVLWLKRGLWLQLLGQALAVGGAAEILVTSLLGGLPSQATPVGRLVLALGLAISGACLLHERHAAPRGREPEYARAVRWLWSGPGSRRYIGTALILGVILPLLLLTLSQGSGWDGLGARMAAIAALVGAWGRRA